jgi:dTDP-4-amino-4,6-dideoxygalactose transaminase
MISRRDIRIKNFELDSLKYLRLLIKKRIDFLFLFKKNLESYIKCKNIYLLSYGRLCFNLIFNSVDYCIGDEIIVPSYYLKSLLKYFKYAKLKIKFVDVDISNYCIDLSELEKSITNKTRFVIVAHMFGECCDIDKLKKIKKKYPNLIFIEDCAHSINSTYKTNKLGSIFDFALLSFDYIKPINTLGGGALIVNNKNYINKIDNLYLDFKKPSLFKTFNKIVSYYFEKIIFNTGLLNFATIILNNKKFRIKIQKSHNSLYYKKYERLSNYQAYLGYIQLKKIDRKQNKLRLKKSYLINLLDDELKKGIQLSNCDQISNYNLTIKLPIFLLISEKINITNEQRKCNNVGLLKKIRVDLKKLNIDCGIEFEIMDICNESSYNAKNIYYTLIQIPFYYNLKKCQIKYIAESINKLYRLYSKKIKRCD